MDAQRLRFTVLYGIDFWARRQKTTKGAWIDTVGDECREKCLNILYAHNTTEIDMMGGQY